MTDELVAACRTVSQRASQTIVIAKGNNWLLDIALDHLTLGRAALYEALLSSDSHSSSSMPEYMFVDAKVTSLRFQGLGTR